MAQIVVRNIDEEVKVRLKRRASRHGHSMEEEMRQILRSALGDEGHRVVKLGSKISARFAGKGLTQDLPEFHGQIVAPMDLA